VTPKKLLNQIKRAFKIKIKKFQKQDETTKSKKITTGKGTKNQCSQKS
jgi:hypothetical protein